MAGNVKVCNLDLIAPVHKRELVIGDKHYDVVPLTVQKFIEFTKAREGITASSSLEDGVKLMMKLIESAVPDLEEELLNAMTLNQLQTIVAFINDEIPDEVLTKGEAAEEAKVEDQKTEGEASGK